MDTADVLRTFDLQIRRHAPADDQDSMVEFTGRLVRHSGPADGWNGVIWSDLDDASADAVIAEEVKHFTARGVAFEWKQYAHDLPADLDRRLLAAGFEAEPAEAVMVAESAGQAVHLDPPDGITLRPVVGAEDVELMVHVHERAFGTSGERVRHQVTRQLAELPEHFAAVIAMDGETPVSAGRVVLHEGTEFASLWSGGTVPEARGRGIYRSLVAYRARFAAERGYRYLQVDAMDDSRPILARLGFAILTTTTPYVYTP